MKITFPHMGNVHIAIKALLEGLKLEVIPPPPVTRKTLELGVKYSPEFACMPLKINIGNFIEAMDKGADTILMAGGWGPCRFGYYAQVEREILSDLGYDFQMIVLEAPDSKISDLLKQIKSLGENVSLREFARVIRFAWYKLNMIEELERKLEYILPRSSQKEVAEKIYEQGLKDIEQAGSRIEVERAVNLALEKMEQLPRHQQAILRIGLVGEIYTILEPSANYNIARCLGYLNAEITRSMYTSEWVNDHLFGGIIKKSDHKRIMNSSPPYLNHEVGGHGRETVGYAVDFARRKFDGIVQIGPLTCMPEIVAQSVLGKVGEMENIPYMTLYFDEHAGTAGIYTRLEAFMDMLKRKKLRQVSSLANA
ncbi:MAG: CoA protein activase [Syntrophomonas sp.]